MDTKQVEVACPCCQSRLLIDVRTERVLRTQPPGQAASAEHKKPGEADWSRALGKVKEREDGGPSKLDGFLQQEKDKSGRLDEKFREARKKLEGRERDES